MPTSPRTKSEVGEEKAVEGKEPRWVQFVVEALDLDDVQVVLAVPGVAEGDLQKIKQG